MDTPHNQYFWSTIHRSFDKLVIKCLFLLTDDSLVHLAGIFHNLYMKIEETEQVWPLTQFFLFAFCKKNHSYARKPINGPLLGRIVPFFHPATPSSWFRTTKGFFTATAPFKVHYLHFACHLRNCRDTRTPSGVPSLGPRTRANRIRWCS